MSIKLIAIDIDGTLVNNDLEITPKTLAVLQRAQQAGIKVVITTGRPLSGFQNYLNQLGINHQANQYVICYNGSLLETTDQKIIAHQSITLDDYFDLELFARRHRAYINLSTPDCMYTSNQDISPVAIYEANKVHIALKYRTLDQLEKMRDHLQVIKGMILDNPQKLDHMQADIPADFKQRFTILRSEVNYLEFISKQASKEACLKKLASYLHLQPAEIMAFGNGYNDIGMVKFAGIGVAMANGVKKLRDQANYVTSDNNHDGIAKAVNKFALKKNQ